MTTEHEASRTLVKSPPELWAECSDAGSLARHLGEFGEIAITRLDPETTVAWEGERVSGTVRIEPSGWGTKVTLTAETQRDEAEEVMETADESPPPASNAPDAESPPQAELPTPPDQEENDAKVEKTLEDADPEPVADAGPARARWRRLTARMRGLFGPVESLEEAAPSQEEPEAELEEPSADPAPASAEVEAEPEAELDPEPEPEPAAVPDPDPAPSVPQLDAEAILTSALDSLGQAHHRPFSRA